MMKKLKLNSMVAVAAGMMSLSSVAMAKAELLCNKKQTKCVADSTRLTIGDEVGIFNTDGEMVAKGEVMAMKGERRAVQINKRYGSVRRDYKLALLETKPGDGGVANYAVYKNPAENLIGASAGLSTITIGEGSPAAEYSAFGQHRLDSGLLLVGRAVFTAMEGEVTRYGELNGLERQPISVSGFGLLGGIGYTVREGKTLAFRGELAAGGMFVSADIGGDADAVNDPNYEARVRNGMNWYGRGSVGLMLNLSSWHVHMDVAQSAIYQASATTLAVGLSKDLK